MTGGTRRTAVVVGGAGGIGGAACRRLAVDGHAVVVADRNATAGMALAAELGVDHRFEALDVTDELQVEEVFARVEAQSPPAVLVIFAGGPLAVPGQDASITSISPAQWRQSVELNLTGTFLCIRQFVGLRQAGPLADSRIVACSSLSGQVGGLPTGAAYSAAKAGVIGLVRHVAAECAASGMTVNGIAPGAVGTDEFYRFLKEEEVDGLRKTVPLNRIATVDEIAAAVSFLASVEASYVTGVTLDVNGGILMR